MITARILGLILAAAVAIGGVTAAVADDGDDGLEGLQAVDLRKDDAGADVELVDEEDDDSAGDRDKTVGDDGTNLGHNHDRDATAGDDGSSGGDNSEVAVAPAPAPAPAPVYDDYSDDGYAYGGSDG